MDFSLSNNSSSLSLSLFSPSPSLSSPFPSPSQGLTCSTRVGHDAGSRHARERRPGARGGERRRGSRGRRFVAIKLSERRFANSPEEVGRLLVEGRLEGFRAQEESSLCHRGGRAQNERERTSERASERERAFSSCSHLSCSLAATERKREMKKREREPKKQATEQKTKSS